MADSNDEVEVTQFDIKVSDESSIDTRKLEDFSKAEVERTRRFEVSGSASAPKLGKIQDIRITVRYDANGGSVDIRFTETVGPYHITGGRTKIGLKDAAGAVLAEWDFPLFSQCGTHSRSHSDSLTRDAAERMTGAMQFSSVGYVDLRRC